MLQDNLAKAIDLIEQSNENKRTEKESSEAIKKNNSFFYSLEQLSNTVNVYVLVKEKFGFMVSVDVQNRLNQLMEYVYQVFQRENVTDVRTFQKNVDKVTKDIEQEWNIFFSTQNRQLIADFKIYGILMGNNIKVRQIMYFFDKCSKFQKINAEGIANYFSAVKEAEAILKKMSFDEDIINFIQMANQGTALFSHLTPKIIEWIRKEDMAERIKISIQ